MCQFHFNFQRTEYVCLSSDMCLHFVIYYATIKPILTIYFSIAKVCFPSAINSEYYSFYCFSKENPNQASSQQFFLSHSNNIFWLFLLSLSPTLQSFSLSLSGFLLPLPPNPHQLFFLYSQLLRNKATFLLLLRQGFENIFKWSNVNREQTLFDSRIFAPLKLS